MKNTWLKHINMKSLKFIYNLKNISINHMEHNLETNNHHNNNLDKLIRAKDRTIMHKIRDLIKQAINNKIEGIILIQVL